MGWVDSRVGLGWVGSIFCSFRWVGLGCIKYDKSTIFFCDYTTYSCKGPWKLNTRGMKNLAFFDQYLASFRQEAQLSQRDRAALRH